MSSKDRVRPRISFVSPEGKSFDAYWIGDLRRLTKKLALFNFVNVQGTVAQNLKSMSRDYPFTFFFAGKDHDLEAEDFFNELDNQDGTWEVTHPTRGYMVLQPKNLSEAIEPVKDANRTVFTSEWMEPIDPETLLTGAQLAALQGKALNDFNDLSSEQFNDNLSLDTEAEIQAVKAETRNLLDKIKAATKTMSAAVTGIQDRMNNAQLALEDALDSVFLDPLLIAGQIQQLVQTPALALQSIKSRMEYYGTLAKSILGRSNDDNDSVARNRSAVKELGASSVLGTYSIIGFTASKPGGTAGSPAATGPTIATATQLETTDDASLQTKNSVLDSISNILDGSKEITDGLDADQDKYKDLPLQWQFFSQSKSFLKGQELMALTAKYLENDFYSAAIEKRFILKVSKSTMEVTIEKYGSAGEKDANYNLLVLSNELLDGEIFLLPARKEIVIYG